MGNSIVVDGEPSCTSCSHSDDKTIVERHTCYVVDNHKEGEEYLKTQYLEELKELGKDDVIVTDSIKLSTEFESLLFDSKTVTELIEKSNNNHSELNYIFFNLSENLIAKMSKENNKDYKIDKNYILRNKELIMKNQKMEHLSEFQEKYDLDDITYNSKMLRNKEEQE